MSFLEIMFHCSAFELPLAYGRGDNGLGDRKVSCPWSLLVFC